MGFIQEFKAFAMRGNVMDMAVGVIIGGAFGKIITSLVDDILMPVIGVATGGVDFSDLSVKIMDAEVKYGNFVQNIIDFLIVALCIFIMIKAMNKLTTKKKEEEASAAPAGPTQEELLQQILDEMRKK
ncbi:MAG: large conductance mechanosensitive channel protein MscL [Bacteroidales bacterium]|nr:large conductance mechanosensitive channel protein MscL [Candidatus Equimonas enterica]